MRTAALPSVLLLVACASPAPVTQRPAPAPTAEGSAALPVRPIVPTATVTAIASASAAPPATSSAPALVWAFDARISVEDGGRDRESVISLDSVRVRSLAELTKKLATMVQKRGKLHVLFVNSSYGVAPEDVEATRKAVEKAGISDITFGVIPLEPP